MLIWQSGFDSRPGKICPFFIVFASTLHSPSTQCVPRNVSPVKKHQEKNLRSPLELLALSDTQRALPYVLQSMAFRQPRQLFTDFVKHKRTDLREVLGSHCDTNEDSSLLDLCKKKAAILDFPFPCQRHNFLPALANRISDNPRSTSRLYIGTIPIKPTNFSSPQVWPPLSSLNFPSCSTTNSTDCITLQLPLAQLFTFPYLQITSIFSGASNIRGLQEPEVGGKAIFPKFR